MRIHPAEAFRQYLKDKGILLSILAPLSLIPDDENLAHAVVTHIHKTFDSDRLKALADYLKKEGIVVGELLANTCLTGCGLHAWIRAHPNAIRELAQRYD